ncbi:hypothetical protein ACKKBG_A06750 [Auxenochlorella protothecoides x Auxenochlorella symbiontica]
MEHPLEAAPAPQEIPLTSCPGTEVETLQHHMAQCVADLEAVKEALLACPDDPELLEAKQLLEESLEGAQEDARLPDDGTLIQKDGSRSASPSLPQAATPPPAPLPHAPRVAGRGAPNNARINPRSRYAQEEPDFGDLAQAYPYLRPFLVPRGTGRPSLNFRDPRACVALTRALLARDHGLRWDLPPGHLAPPVTGRANYVHWVQDLLALSAPEGGEVCGLDVGTGANLIYPLLGAALAGWRFVGVDVSRAALRAARRLLDANTGVARRVTLRRVPMQPEQRAFFHGMEAAPEGPREEGDGGGGERGAASGGAWEEVSARDAAGGGILSAALRAGEAFAFCMCNPPFFESLDEAGRNPATAFGGTPLEMVYPGGEAAFVLSMLADSCTLRSHIHWFTTMVGKKSTLRALRGALARAGARVVRTTEFAQGRTSRWGVAWSWAAPAAAAAAPLRAPAGRGAAAALDPARRRHMRPVRTEASAVLRALCEAARGSGRVLREVDPQAFSLTVEVGGGGGGLGGGVAAGAKRPREAPTSGPGDDRGPHPALARFQVFQQARGEQTVAASLEGASVGGDFAELVSAMWAALDGL